MLTSSTIQEAEATIQDDEDDYKAGEWVLVQYEGKYYPGEVMGKEGDSYCVNVMIPAGKNWRWPQNHFQILYEKENIVKKLGLPLVVNSRNHFCFDVTISVLKPVLDMY
ncbi:hypothetical protein JTE90_003390 [Oedothorax gibbosus]|uniref:Uncharacterized protein n=1 Tax=Oedothorax gibbosus TaxID=931172 RepID=A0AAV6TY72_9ARAC|nr:hypothetical protein JTE90_003390 [Oedothorax gibbosus]